MTSFALAILVFVFAATRSVLSRTYQVSFQYLRLLKNKQNASWIAVL